MKTWLLHTPDLIENRPLQLAEISKHIPQADELLIKVAACGICRTDLHVTEGDLNPRLVPVTPGHQIVGRIERLGDSVEGFSEGQRVGVAWLYSTCGTCRFCLS